MIVLENINKSFKNKKVLRNLSLIVRDGKITALVGKNGCGKTTLVRLISGLIKPDSGTIINSDKNIGVFLGGDTKLYDNLTGYENIKFFAGMHKIDNKQFHNRFDELSEILKFKDFANEKASYYSRGMTQKIGFAISVIHNPNTIILDEPSTGLDIIAANDVINFINYCKHQNKTILISSHNMAEISDMSDYIAIIKDKSIALYDETSVFFSNATGTEKTNILANFLEIK